jgi:hypothetical protein
LKSAGTSTASRSPNGYRFGFKEVEAEDREDGQDGEVQWIQEVGNKSLVGSNGQWRLDEALVTDFLDPLYFAVLSIFTILSFNFLDSFGDREAVLVPADFKYVEFRGRE